jgi:hypothetical protein
LPPWLSTKKFFILLALLIPGKKSVTSKVFNVYLEPLVEEFLQLWSRVLAYDCTKDIGCKAFTSQAVLMWIIHDFPGYGTVGGFSHQGYATCPWYGAQVGAKHSLELGKQTYGSTRRWLPEDHKYWSVEFKDHLNGEVESQLKPKAVSMEEQLEHAAEYAAWKVVGNTAGIASDPLKIHGVKRASILFRLPY